MSRHRRSRTPLVIIIISVAASVTLILMSGGGSSVQDATTPAPATAAPAPGSGEDSGAMVGYLGSDGTRILFIHWTRSGDSLTGGIESVHDSSGTSVGHETLTGTQTGASVILAVGGTTWTGALTGDYEKTLLLRLPGSGGTFHQVELHKAGVDDYDAAVAAMRREATNGADPTASR